VAPEADAAPATLSVATEESTVGVTCTCVSAYGTVAVYAVTADENAGASVTPPVADASHERSAFASSRRAVIVYVCLFPACAVISTVATLFPTESAIEPEVDPEADPDDDFDFPPEIPSPATIVRRDDHWLIGDSEARFVKLSAGACGKGECLEVVGALPEEYFDRDTVIRPLPDGTLLLWEEQTLRHLGADLSVRFEARGRDALDGVVVTPSGKTFVSIDDDLLELDLTRCASRRPFAP
ncbi:MAG: hypothetical protein AAF721_37915, partial [Myxococcota bacterium]